MQYLQFTYVDVVTGVPVTDEPPRNGPAMPDVDGVQFAWARESQYPTLTPELFGTCPASSDTDKPGVVAVLSEDEWLAAREREMAGRRAKTARQIADRRYSAETTGTTVSGMPLDTGRDSQALITGAALAAMLDSDYTVRWKTQGGFVELDAAQIIAVASAVRAHVQACFDREAELLAELDADTFTPEMLEEGWPDGQVSAPAES